MLHYAATIFKMLGGSKVLDALKSISQYTVSAYTCGQLNIVWYFHGFMDAEVCKMLRKDTPQGVRRRSSFVIGVVTVELLTWSNLQLSILWKNDMGMTEFDESISICSCLGCNLNYLGFKKCSVLNILRYSSV